MARITIDDLSPRQVQQMLNEITDGEMNTVEGSQGIDINQQSLANNLDQNLDNLIFSLRTQMGVVIVGARTIFNEGFNSL
ncbi:hypothetical protein [Anabaenopsis elenkinii]|uniref:Uncharacterized protein n=1 Tax=Anabaenopsis elenkinii CCIBt3563 TaxID=2779889 RepID=A0A7U3NM48_9CYAN|nr:hypothetical protein [Anabaenopsis elenkinii]QOV21468.1 hypothetical protein IM676_11955 [Anabaenopsis elenkinii CCIBt3563]